MRDEWECEILTTCARSSDTWANEYPAGETEIGGIPARRFAVDRPRSKRSFDRASARVASGAADRTEQIAWMREQGPDASSLVRHLALSGATYDCVFFFSYLYATTYFGLPHVRDRAVVVPLAHDEWMLRVPIVAEVFSEDVLFAFVSDEERSLVETRFGARRGAMLDVAIAAPSAARPELFRERFIMHDPFVLYVGRVDAAKSVDALVRDFSALVRARRTSLRLVLVGPVSLDLPHGDGVTAVGRLSEDEKWSAIAAARFVINPSQFESLSLATLEAWGAGKGVLVNGASAVLVGQSRRANAGLWYGNPSEFSELVETELFGAADALGANGRRFVEAHCTLEHARVSLRACYDEILRRREVPPQKRD